MTKKKDGKMSRIFDPWGEAAKKNNNRRYDVQGTVEIGDDGYVEVCLLTADGKAQVLHLHRYTEGMGKAIRWDCWVFENNWKGRNHLFMSEKRRKEAEK